MSVNCASRKCVCFNVFPCAVSSVREPMGWCKQGRSSNNPRPRCQDLASTRHWAMYHLLMITGYLLHSITHKFQRHNSLSLWRQFRAALCRDDALHANWDDSDPLGSLPGRNWSTLRSCCCLQHVPAFPGSSHLPPCSCSIQESQGFLKSKANPTTSLCDGPLSCRPTLPHTTSLGHFPHIWVVLYFFRLLMFMLQQRFYPASHCPFPPEPFIMFWDTWSVLLFAQHSFLCVLLIGQSTWPGRTPVRDPVIPVSDEVGFVQAGMAIDYYHCFKQEHRLSEIPCLRSNNYYINF